MPEGVVLFSQKENKVILVNSEFKRLFHLPKESTCNQIQEFI